MDTQIIWLVALFSFSHAFAFLNQVQAASLQIPLGTHSSSPLFGASRDKVRLHEQSVELCNTVSRQWTGSIQITEEKDIFFWYFESQNNPAEDPVVLWMSGGPGAASALGMFKGPGPCWINDDGNSTSPNKNSWTNRANVIFIDQPAGVGYSTIANTSRMPSSLQEGAEDLYTFLEIFVTEAFPDTINKVWHITGESMAGHYIPFYTKYIMERQMEQAKLGLNIDIRSIIAVDPYLDLAQHGSGFYDVFCSSEYRENGWGQTLMNHTACETMAAAIPECERLASQCRYTYDKNICEIAAMTCFATVGKYFWDEVLRGERSPFDSRLRCRNPPSCRDHVEKNIERFMNQPWVQKMIGVAGYPYQLVNSDMNQKWVTEKTLFIPTTDELAWILQHTDTNLVFLNGNKDVIMNTPNLIRLLDMTPSSHQAGFRNQKLQDWFYTDSVDFAVQQTSGGLQKGGQFKYEGRLWLFTVDNAGHTSAYDEPVAIEAIVNWWLARFQETRGGD